MSYLDVRGNLGGNFTQVRGLSPPDLEHLQRFLRGVKSEDPIEVSFHNPVVTVLNELELQLGYQVTACSNTSKSHTRFPDVVMWTMYRPDRW
ncbi:hypothetical protein GE061_019926 [Apolygus lucorum]|uniref:Uncharacterized protein n=1 Tax=Apolygus lucorum TaxID=248454 RepID=A0A8S9X9Y2_APOLU|nr:hypothetical protein GE061_019926 [Apolygus lucorum]